MNQNIKDKIDNNINPFTSVKPKVIGDVLQDLNEHSLEEAPVDGKTYGRKDANWVEVTGGGSSYNFSNGLTTSGNDVKLGGEITEDTLIVAGDITNSDVRGVYISPTAKQVALINYNNPTVANLSLNADGKITLSSTNSANSDTAYLEISEDRDLTLGTGISSLGERRVDIHTEGSFLIKDSITNKGLEYPADYSANFTDRSLVDKAYVDSKSSSIVIATDAELQTQTTPAEDNKIVSRHGLIFWWNWIKTQAVNITARWQFNGIGLGKTAEVSSYLDLAPNTSSVAQTVLNPSTTDYTGTREGATWNNNGEFKFIDTGGLVNRQVKIYNNELFKGVVNRALEVNKLGDLTATDEIIEAYIFDTGVIGAITSATYTNNRATITAVAGVSALAGQYYDDGTYTYFVLADNYIRRF